MAFRTDFLKRAPLLLLFLLAACAWNEPDIVELPKDIGAAATPFVSALQKGDQIAAQRHVASTAKDELDASFQSDTNALKSSPALTPRFISYKPETMMGPQDSEVTIIYAAKDDGKWTTAEVRLFRLGDEPYEVDHWAIDNKAPVAKAYTPNLRPLYRLFAALAGTIILFGLLAIGLTLWIVRRKPQLVAPTPVAERRIAAVTTREGAEDISARL